MSFKEKVKNFGKAILSIPIGLVIAIPFIISLPMIPIISIFGLISKFLVKSRQEKESTDEEKEFTASNALKEAFEEFQADSLPRHKVLKDNEQSNVPDLTSNEKRRIARFGEELYPHTDVPELIKTHLDKDEVMKKLLFGHISLCEPRVTTIIKDFFQSRKEESVVRDVVRRITIIPKIFLFLFLRALEAIGLSHVKLPKSETYKKEITAESRLFKFEAMMLLNLLNRSTMEEELAKSLHGSIVNLILREAPFSCIRLSPSFIGKCKEITVTPLDHPEYEKINNKTVEKIAGIFRLLTNVKLGLLSSDDEKFKNQFNHEVYNLLKYACFSALCTPTDPLKDEQSIPSLDSKLVQGLQKGFSNFLDNLLQSKAVSRLSKEEQADYIDILCTKVLKACISYGSIYASKCFLESRSSLLPSSYSKHVDNIATHLSNDIIKTFSPGQLNYAYLKADISESLFGLFSREGIVDELCSPMESIMCIIINYTTKYRSPFLETDRSVPDGIKIGEIESQPAPSLSETLSSQDKARVNGQQV